MQAYRIHPSRNKGAALALLVLALGVMLTAMLLASLGGKSALRARTEKTTQEALNAAKIALINSAISINGSVTPQPTDRPGEILCPDRNVPDPDPTKDIVGRSGLNKDGLCNAQQVGRITWRILQLPQYKDGSGEPLWYMVAPPFQEKTSTAAINSNTIGPLQAFTNMGNITLASPTAANNNNGAVAIIFAPGAPLTGQNRSTPAQQTNVNNYLDQITINGVLYNNQVNGAARHLNGPVTCQDLPTDARCNGKPDASMVLFNDQLVVITRDEIMNSVRQRAAREYPQAFAKRNITPTCPNTHPPKISTTPSDSYNWLGQNNWDNILTYKTCPTVLQ